jgi:hypothetical protein
MRGIPAAALGTAVLDGEAMAEGPAQQLPALHGERSHKGTASDASAITTYRVLIVFSLLSKMIPLISPERPEYHADDG